jgi:hypothetical protein
VGLARKRSAHFTPFFAHESLVEWSCDRPRERDHVANTAIAHTPLSFVAMMPAEENGTPKANLQSTFR